jgi:hypothetical protein
MKLFLDFIREDLEGDSYSWRPSSNFYFTILIISFYFFKFSIIISIYY